MFLTINVQSFFLITFLLFFHIPKWHIWDLNPNPLHLPFVQLGV